MAVIKLKVDSNFREASKDFEKFADTSQSAQKRLDKLKQAVDGAEFDKFNNSLNRAKAAITATRGPTAGLEHAQSRLRAQMEKMIRGGVDPLDASLVRLQKEYDRTTRQIEINSRASQANAKLTQMANRAFVALGAAAIASGAAILKNTFEMAKAGDQYAKVARTIGITAEDLQELQFVADRSGVSSDKLNSALQKLNKNVGDVRAGTGALTTLLKQQNPELLAQLKTVESNDEAFSILTTELGNMTNAADRASLAQAAFGRTGQDLINVAVLGADGISALRDEARSYGLISNDAAAQSEAFVDAQTNALSAVKGIRAEMAEKLLPAITSVLRGFTNFITDSDRINRLLNVMLPILAGVAGGLLAFLVITKIIAIVKGFTTAMAVLNAVLAANPVILIAAAIAIVIAAIVLLIRNWDKVVVVIGSTVAKLQARFEQFGSAISTTWTRAINNLKIVFLELGGIILNKVLGAVNKLLDLASKIPFVGDKFANLQDSVNGFATELEQARLNALSGSEAAIQAAKDEQAAAKARADAAITGINAESAARLAALKEQEEANANLNTTGPTATGPDGVDPNTGTTDPTALADRLATLNNIEAMANQERLATFGDFLKARMEQEGIAGEDRILFLQNELLRIQELTNISNAEKISAEKAVQDQITEIERQAAADRVALRRRELSATGDLFSSLSELVTAYGEDNEAAVQASKALAATSAAINSYLAFTQVLADPSLPFFLKAVSAASILATGLAQQKNIWSAETGGSFTVPNSSQSSRVDSQTMRVNPGEEINVTPRGGQSNKAMTVNVMVDKRMIWSITQEGLDSNEITVSNDNLRAG